MTVTDLIQSTLHRIAGTFYYLNGEFRQREYWRDHRALMGAVARYGYECEKRGWHFDADFISTEISRVLSKCETERAHIDYLPVYLQAAVDAAVRQKAEELSVQARKIAPHCARIVAGTHSVQAVVEQSDTEVLSALYRNLRRKKGRQIGKQLGLKLA